MARPFLADPDFVNKAAADKADRINTCIACNQACLDHTFQLKLTSCLVNPRACHETVLVIEPTQSSRRIAVVGAGPAGLAAAVTAAQRGHDVTLFDADDRIGGQFNLAAQIPGKEEFTETLRYYRNALMDTGVEVRLGARVGPDELTGSTRSFWPPGSPAHPRHPGHRPPEGGQLSRRPARPRPGRQERGDHGRRRDRLRRRRVPHAVWAQCHRRAGPLLRAVGHRRDPQQPRRDRRTCRSPLPAR